MKRTFILILFVLSAIVSSAQLINNSFFEKVPYIGAFGTEDWTQGWSNWKPQDMNYPAITDSLEGEITSNLTLLSSKVYLIKGFVYVTDGVTLTIPAGTVLRGDKNTKGTLIVEKGARIIAQGTSANPIVLTSNSRAGSRSYGDWGGLVICGKAPINVPGGSATIEGGPRSTYGGNDENDNSGILKYVRIEFGGIPLLPDKEINGLTMGGVGRATEIDYVQVSYNGDDAFEWFGGTVNARHLISFRTWDDDFDSDFGWRGMVQFAVALRDPSIADVSGSNGFESDNDGSGSVNTPLTKPVFSNISVFGPKVTSSTTVNSNFKRAMHLRRNTNLNVYNSIFAGYPTGLFIDGTATQANATNDSLRVAYTILSGMGSFFASDFERNYFKATARKNDTLANNSDLLITDPFNLSNPNFLPLSNSPVLNRSIWSTVGIEEEMPLTSTQFITCYPNPFSASATLLFELNKRTDVNIELLDITGRVMQTILNTSLSEGSYQVNFTSASLYSGIYLIRSVVDGVVSVSKVRIY